MLSKPCPFFCHTLKNVFQIRQEYCARFVICFIDTNLFLLVLNS